MATGLTFGSEKDKLRMVVDNGVSADDPRVMTRTNEATQELLAELIPVNGMMEVNVTADANNQLLLPKEMDAAIYAEALGGAKVWGDTDVVTSHYDIVNPYTYLDPGMAHDNPLVDHFLVSDPNNPTILRRQYGFPGLDPGAVVKVVGPKRYLPITSDADSLIIQNVPALKLMIQAIEYRENRSVDDAAKYKALAVELLTAEVKKHLMDPRWVMKRKSRYLNDLTSFKRGSMAWTRARIALEVPGAINMGRRELAQLMERAEERLMETGIWKGCLEEFDADVVCGHVVLPGRVESVLAATLCGESLPIRSIFFKYLENGPGEDCGCPRLMDEGEIVLSDGTSRRKYYLNGAGGDYTPSGSSSSSSSGGSSGGTISTFGTLTATDYLYLGDNARLVALINGVALEVKDGGGNWVRQGNWTE